MVEKPWMYMLLFTVIAGFVGFCGWLLYQWLAIDDPLPDSALKVLGQLIGY